MGHVLRGSVLQMRELRLREGGTQGGRAPGLQWLRRPWRGGGGCFPSVCWAWTVTLEHGWGQALSPRGPTWLSGLRPALARDPPGRGREAGEAVCPAAGGGGGGAGPAPTAAACLARWPHRETAYESQAFKESSAPAGSSSKASLWQEGPSRAAAPAAGTDRAQALCQRAAPALTRGQRDRGSCLQEAGDLPAEGLPWAH